MLSVCVVTYNTPERIRECLASVHGTLKTVDYELLVLDLGTDSTIPKTENTRFWRRKPSYFAKSYNFLASRARGDSLLILNSDVILKPNCVYLMLKELDKDVGIVGCRLIYPPESPTAGLIMHAGVYLQLMPNSSEVAFVDRGMYHQDSALFHHTQDVPVVTGACMLIRTGAFLAVGPFDERYKNGREDIALCLGMWEHGWRVRYCGQAAAYHLQNGTGGTNNLGKTSLEFDDYNRAVLNKHLRDKEPLIKKLSQLQP